MTLTYGFYNSVSGDRSYDAIQVSSMFTGVLTDGVFQYIGNKLVVTDGTGLGVIVGTGKAWFNNTWTNLDAALGLTISTPSVVNPRIDTVVLEVDSSIGVRANTIKIIAGTPAAIPVEPTLVNTSEVHQYPLAHIAVAANATELVPANITNLVGTVYCPYVLFPNAISGDGTNILELQVFS